MKLIMRIVINAIAIWSTTMLLPGLDLGGNIGGLIVAALIFGLVNAFIRPIVQLLTLPLSCLTLGLFALVVNTLMLMLTAWLSGSLVIEGGFWTAFLGAIIISIISSILGWFIPDND